ncbi:MAG: type II secretion system protein [Oligoflexia bacterium]|nr:type II secretion system protein [Oligoflexia bacterium]
MFKLLNEQKGFTLVEILMVIVLISILAIVAVPQFMDFQFDAKKAKAKELGANLRNAIANAKAIAVLRCNKNTNLWPTLADIQDNNVKTNFCDKITESEKALIQAGLPQNPFNRKATVINSALSGATNYNSCADTSDAGTGWCYNTSTGEIWANVSGIGTW